MAPRRSSGASACEKQVRSLFCCPYGLSRTQGVSHLEGYVSRCGGTWKWDRRLKQFACISEDRLNCDPFLSGFCMASLRPCRLFFCVIASDAGPDFPKLWHTDATLWNTEQAVPRRGDGLIVPVDEQFQDQSCVQASERPNLSTFSGPLRSPD